MSASGSLSPLFSPGAARPFLEGEEGAEGYHPGTGEVRALTGNVRKQLPLNMLRCRSDGWPPLLRFASRYILQSSGLAVLMNAPGLVPQVSAPERWKP